MILKNKYVQLNLLIIVFVAIAALFIGNHRPAEAQTYEPPRQIGRYQVERVEDQIIVILDTTNGSFKTYFIVSENMVVQSLTKKRVVPCASYPKDEKE